MTPAIDSLRFPEIVLDFSALDRLPTDQDLPSDDGEPLETIWHRHAMSLLIDSIECHWQGRKDFFVGGNMFVYYSKEPVFHKDFRGPDFFVVKGADHDKKRDSWVYWQEKGRHPNVIIELSSPSTARIDRIEKREVYAEQMRVPEYFIYDPRDDSLIGWRLIGSLYGEPLEVEHGNRIWSNELGMFIGPWDGDYLGDRDRWLRFFDAQGQVIPTFAEAEAAARGGAEAEARAAHAEVERLRNEVDQLRKQQQPPPAP